MIIKITAFIIGLIAIVLTFKAELILEKVFKKRADPRVGPASQIHCTCFSGNCLYGGIYIRKIKLKGVSINGRCKEYSKKIIIRLNLRISCIMSG